VHHHLKPRCRQWKWWYKHRCRWLPGVGLDMEERAVAEMVVVSLAVAARAMVAVADPTLLPRKAMVCLCHTAPSNGGTAHRVCPFVSCT